MPEGELNLCELCGEAVPEGQQYCETCGEPIWTKERREEQDIEQAIEDTDFDAEPDEKCHELEKVETTEADHDD